MEMFKVYFPYERVFINLTDFKEYKTWTGKPMNKPDSDESFSCAYRGHEEQQVPGMLDYLLR